MQDCMQDRTALPQSSVIRAFWLCPYYSGMGRFLQAFSNYFQQLNLLLNWEKKASPLDKIASEIAPGVTTSYGAGPHCSMLSVFRCQYLLVTSPSRSSQTEPTQQSIRQYCRPRLNWLKKPYLLRLSVHEGRQRASGSGVDIRSLLFFAKQAILLAHAFLCPWFDSSLLKGRRSRSRHFNHEQFDTVFWLRQERSFNHCRNGTFVPRCHVRISEEFDFIPAKMKC